jgi:transposase
MSTSLLYHAFGIRGYKYSRTEYDNGKVIFTIHQEPETYRCSACGSVQVISRGQVERRFLSLPIGGRGTTVVFAIPRVECQACELVRQVEISFADVRCSYTNWSFAISRRSL